MKRLLIPLLTISCVLLLSACDDPGAGTDEDCEACLDSGGTWQPEVAECTDDCDIMDISCFRDDCPGACEDDCSFCFSSEDCEGQGCTWHDDEDESAWCTN